MLHNTQQNLNRLVISRLLSYRSLIKGLVLYLDIIEKVLVFAFFFGSSSHIKCFSCFTAKETISIRCRYLLFLNLYFKCSRIFHSVLHAKFQFNSREGMFLGYQKETSICVCVFLRKINCLLMKLPTNKSPISKMSGDE